MKRLVKEGYYKGELFSNALRYVEDALSRLNQAANAIRDAEGEDSHLF